MLVSTLALLVAPLLAVSHKPQRQQIIFELKEEGFALPTLADFRGALRNRTEAHVNRIQALSGGDGEETPFACEKWAEGVNCTQFDVIVIGGGPSGLQTALSLGRLGRKTMILDSGRYRNDPTLEAHDVIVLDGLTPKEIRDLARNKLLAIYPTVHYQVGLVTSVEPSEDKSHFVVTSQLAEFTTVYTARKIVLATGVEDTLPKIPGIKGIWGAGGFWCPWCDGWEHRGGHLGVLGMNNADEALVLHNLNPQEITIYTDGVPRKDAALPSGNQPFAEMVEAAKFKVVADKIKRVDLVDPEDRRNSAVRITFETEEQESDGDDDKDGDDDDKKKGPKRHKYEDVKGFLFTTGRPFRSPWLLRQLQVETTTEGGTRTVVPQNGKSGQTTTPGVWSVGDSGGTAKNVAHAIYSGKAAAVNVVFRLAYEEARALANKGWDYAWP